MNYPMTAQVPWMMSSRRRRTYRTVGPLAVFVSIVMAIPLRPAAATTLPSGFTETTFFSGLLTQPTAVRFASDGRIFVAEKGGVIRVFSSLSDTHPTVFADLRTNVHNFWDRGMSGMALHPNFPATPYVYVTYTLDAPIGGTPPVWGVAGQTSDGCPNPPGATTNGCVVGGRLSRLQANGSVMTGSEQVLIESWCQQFPSHSVDSVVFGNDGALYVSAGEGANFINFDYGQYGSPVNPCGDPPGGVGGTMTPPTAEGGALRAQSLRRNPGEPAVLGGSILRVDPNTGAALPDNPLFNSSRPNAARIVAYGFRNPFRMTVRPGTNELWVGDVGWGEWEELDRIASPLDPVVQNFGWPCYEGAAPQRSYSPLNLNLCQSLYGSPGSTVLPYYAYGHTEEVVPGDGCAMGSSSISGLAFYQNGNYPAAYHGALFFADYSRNCIWTMFPDAQGDPDPATRAVFAGGAPGPVDLQIGPNGDLFYVNFSNGDVRRIQATSTNQPPVVSLQANPTYGAVPLTVQFNGAASSDPEGGALSFAWDLDGDGQFNDSAAPAPSYTYTAAGNVTVGLRVTDPQGATASASTVIAAGNTPPMVTINTPSGSTPWNVGDVIAFSGSATDAQDGPLPASALTWSVVIHHCPSNCHTHPLQSFVGVASGSFSAPDHEYPSYLELQLTAKDSAGLSSTTSVLLYPNTVTLSFDSSPLSGLTLTVGSQTAVTPFVATVIVGSATAVNAPSPQGQGGTTYQFVSWSDGGARTHTFVAPSAPAQYVASFEPVQGGVCGDGRLDPGEECDDGNTASGDCCSAACQIEDNSPCDLTQFGTIIALVTSPTGGGNRNIEILRDGDMPPIGNQDSNRQYDTYDGSNPASVSEDWAGYSFAAPQVFSRIVFQEGKHFFDGGWFTSLTAQVRQNGTWTPIGDVSITPAYPGIDNGVTFETYILDFSPVVGDAIRLYGVPGGSAHFVSFGELKVLGGFVLNPPDPPTPTGTPPPTPTATQAATRTASATATRTGSATATATTASGVCGDGRLDAGETCDDGNTASGDCCANCQIEANAPCNLTQAGTIVALVTSPTGGGSRNIEIIRDGDTPPVGSTDSNREYDTYDGSNPASVNEDWIGYTYAIPQVFTRVVFQEGKNFVDGGWFNTLTAQVRRNGTWIPVSNLVVTPAYPGINDNVNFETYRLDFGAVSGDGIRIYGAPGGSAYFMSVGELTVFGGVVANAPPPPTATPTITLPPVPTQTATRTATASLTATSTSTRTATPTSTATRTTKKATATETDTPTPPATATATQTASATASVTRTASATASPTQTQTPVATATATATASHTPTTTRSATATATSTLTATASSSATSTASATATPTRTATATPPPPASATATATASRSVTATASATGTASRTPTATASATATTGAPPPLLAYCFEEGSGPTTTDNSGNGHIGTLINEPTWVAGRYGLGLRFDGNRLGYQYVSIAPDDAFDALSQGTIMAWVKPASATAVYKYWFHSGQNGGCQWPMELGVTNGNFDFWGGSSVCDSTLNALSPIPSPVTDWHHLAYVVSASGNRFYIDGQLAATTYPRGSASSQVFFAQTSGGTSKYRVGATESYLETFDGIIDEVRIYGAPLTQAQVQSAMNSGWCGP